MMNNFTLRDDPPATTEATSGIGRQLGFASDFEFQAVPRPP
jgi:hypothetical protein